MNQQQQFENVILKVYEQKLQNQKLISNSDYSELLQRIKRIREFGPNSSNKNDYYVVNTYNLQTI